METKNPKRYFDSLSFGVQIISSDFRYEFLNTQLLNEINKKEEEIFGKKMEDVFPGIEFSPVFKTIEEVFKKRKPKSLINEFTLPDGKTTYYKLKLENMGSSVIIFSEDITEEKNLEILLEKKNARLEDEVQKRSKELSLFLDGLHDYAIIFLNPEGIITRWHKGAEFIFGYREEEMIGKTIEILFTEEELKHKALGKEFKKAKENNKFEHSGWRIKKDGSKIYARITLHAIRDDRRKLLGYSKLVQDISEKQAYENKLRESNEKFKTFFANSPDACLIMSLNGGRILECNKATEILLGGTQDQILGLTPDTLSPALQPCGEKSSSLVVEKIKTVLEKSHCRFEWIHTKLSGEEFSCDVNISLINYHTEKALLVTWRDISDRALLEKELRKEKEKALAQADFKSKFLAQMSHDIRTPLNSITGMVDVLSETQLSDSQSNYLKTIEQSCLTLLELINDILDLSKIEAGELTLTEKEFNFEDCLVSAIDIVAVQARKRNTDVFISELPQFQNYLRGDETRLRQVLINILGNAAKFTENGTIWIEVKIIKNKLSIAVHDTGIGIPTNKLPTIFDSYKQASKNTSQKFGGTGLGLSISKLLVGLMEGDIEATSELKKGSTFTITVPLEEGKVLEKVAANKAALEGKKVALFLENSLEEESITSIVESYKGIISSYKKENLDDIAKDNLHDCYIIDSDISNIDIFTILKNFPSIAKKSLLLLPSGKHSRSAVLKAKKVGMTGIQIRPFKSLAFVELLKEVSSGQKTLEEKKQAKAKIANFSDLHILIVDDVTTNRDLLRAYLKKTGCKVTMAENGQEALEKFKENLFDLVFMDMFMPVLGGVQATYEIRKWETENNQEKTPILALTANAFDTDAREMLEAGCDEFLTKPIRKTTFIEVIEKYIKL